MVYYNNAKTPRCSAGADPASKTFQEGNTFGRSNCTGVSPYNDSDATNAGLDERCVNVVNLTSDFPVGLISFMKTALGLNCHDPVENKGEESGELVFSSSLPANS